MDLKLIFAHFLLAVGLFFTHNWIGSHFIPAGYIWMSVLAKADV
jgi:hypothetical protein